jgi:hypothetical protein
MYRVRAAVKPCLGWWRQVAAGQAGIDTTDQQAAGKAPTRRGDPGCSSKLDRAGDGIACENLARMRLPVMSPRFSRRLSPIGGFGPSARG